MTDSTQRRLAYKAEVVSRVVHTDRATTPRRQANWRTTPDLTSNNKTDGVGTESIACVKVCASAIRPLAHDTKRRFRDVERWTPVTLATDRTTQVRRYADNKLQTCTSMHTRAARVPFLCFRRVENTIVTHSDGSAPRRRDYAPHTRT